MDFTKQPIYKQTHKHAGWCWFINDYIVLLFNYAILGISYTVLEAKNAQIVFKTLKLPPALFGKILQLQITHQFMLTYLTFDLTIKQQYTALTI